MKIKKMKNKLNAGFTTIDIIISITVIMIFISIITMLFYNFYITATARHRNAIATNYVIDIIEQVKMMQYDDIDSDNVNNEVIEKLNIAKGYNLVVDITRYNSTEGNETKEDIIKILKVSVDYTLGNKKEKIEISTLLTK